MTTDSGAFKRVFTTESATSSVACYESPLEWVPDHSGGVVPPANLQLCRSCPLRAACLQWAVDAEEYGYWAGTTEVDRKTLRAAGTVSIAAAEAAQAAVRAAADTPAPTHAPGQGSYRKYRAGCHCGECRAANRAQRRNERSTARGRTDDRELQAA